MVESVLETPEWGRLNGAWLNLSDVSFAAENPPNRVVLWFVPKGVSIPCDWRCFGSPSVQHKLVECHSKAGRRWNFSKPLMGTSKVARGTGDILPCFYPPFWSFSLWWYSPRDITIVFHWFITHKSDMWTINFNPDYVCMLVYPPHNIFSFSHSFSHPSLYCFLVVWHICFVSAHWTLCINYLSAIGTSGRSNWDTFLLHCIIWYAVFMMK